MGIIPGSGKPHEEGNGNPRQYSSLENSMNREAWQATVHGVGKELDTTSRLNNNISEATILLYFVFSIFFFVLGKCFSILDNWNKNRKSEFFFLSIKLIHRSVFQASGLILPLLLQSPNSFPSHCYSGNVLPNLIFAVMCPAFKFNLDHWPFEAR